MVGSLINICHALSKLSHFFGWEKSKISVEEVLLFSLEFYNEEVRLERPETTPALVSGFIPVSILGILRYIPASYQPRNRLGPNTRIWLV
jgi:hypothetical protein